MRLAVNISANAAARLWVAVLQIVVTPIIIRLLGPDSYGLVAFSVTIGVFLTFLDQSLSPAVARELARVNGQDCASQQDARDLLRTGEAISGGTGLLVGGAIVLAAPWIASHALAAGSLPLSQVTTAIQLMGFGIAAQWPSMLYAGGFAGLQRQDILVAIRVIGGTLSSLGAVALMVWRGPSIELFLGWTALVALAISCALGIALWRIMPRGSRPVFDIRICQRLWRFAAGSLLIGFTGAVLGYVPGLLVAKYCTLAQLAAYSISVSLAQQVSTLLTGPVVSTLTPHFTQLFARGDADKVEREYHRWSQIIVALLLPVAGTLMAFPRPLIAAWLGRDSPLLGPVSELLPWIVLGTLLNGVAVMPYALQVAYGWTRNIIKFNCFLIVCLLPLLGWLLPIYGIRAAAWLWVASNLAYFVVLVPLTHARLLPGALWSWWGRDTGLPAAITLAVFVVSRAISNPPLPNLAAAFQIAVTAAVSMALITALQPLLRIEAARVYGFLKRRL
jgi:O-antigen/teichoic acid export membrane protein